MIEDDAPPPPHTRPSRGRALKVLAAGIVLWLLPMLALVAWRGTGSLHAQEYRFFTQADAAGAALVVTFCELPRSYATAALVEPWDGVPPVSEDYAMARDEIVVRIGRLVDGLGAGT